MTTSLVAGAAILSAIAALVAAFNASLTLSRVRENLREQLQPVVVVELRKHAFSKGTQEMVVSNFGQTPARDLQLTFDPDIADPDPEAADLASITAALVRRMLRPIPVLAPGQSIAQIYMTTKAVPGQSKLVKTEPVPDALTVTATYRGIDGHPYSEDFELDTRIASLSTYVTSKDSPEVQRRTIADSLETIAAHIRKIQ